MEDLEAQMGEPTSTSWIWVKPISVVALSLISFVSALVWRQNLQNFHVQNLFGRRLYRRMRWLAAIIDPELSVTINEHDSTGRKMRSEEVYYDEVKAYLAGERSRSARHLRAEGASIDDDADRLVLSMLDGEEVDEQFEGATVWWSAQSSTRRIDGKEHDERMFVLHYQECHRDLVLDQYLAHVQEKGREIMVNDRQRKLFTNLSDNYVEWSHVPFKHPMQFDKLAMDKKKKEEIKKDLEAFQNGKEHYARVGKVWKRGYLLQGPPGTGKTAMIAAMANFLKYDVYIIELTSVKSNSRLQKLLMEIKSKAVIVIEDIDCSLDLTGAREKKKRPAEDGNAEKKEASTPAEDGNGEKKGASTSAEDGNNGEKKGAPTSEDDDNGEKSGASTTSTAGDTGSKVTLSGLLNVVDGLLSACGEERIMVFTTNHVDMLDEALIRKGRMDKRINMSYCGFEAFKILAKMYLDVDDHERFDAVKELLREVNMTPVDVIEELTPKGEDDDAGSCLAALVKALEKKKAKEEKATSAGSSA